MSEENQSKQNNGSRKLSREEIEEIFSDFEAKNNLVGLYDLLLKVARKNPKLWAEINDQNND